MEEGRVVRRKNRYISLHFPGQKDHAEKISYIGLQYLRVVKKKKTHLVFRLWPVSEKTFLCASDQGPESK